MKKLRAEARKLVATCSPDCDFADLVTKLAGVVPPGSSWRVSSSADAQPAL